MKKIHAVWQSKACWGKLQRNLKLMTVTKIFSPSWPKILRFQSGFQAWRKKVLQHWNLIWWVKGMCLNILLKVQNWLQTSHNSHTSFPKSNAWRMVPSSQLKCLNFSSAWYLFLKISMPSLMKGQWNGRSQEAPTSQCYPITSLCHPPPLIIFQKILTFLSLKNLLFTLWVSRKKRITLSPLDRNTLNSRELHLDEHSKFC